MATFIVHVSQSSKFIYCPLRNDSACKSRSGQVGGEVVFSFFYFYFLKFFADDHLLLVKVHIMYILLVSVLTNDGEKMNLHANFINV